MAAALAPEPGALGAAGVLRLALLAGGIGAAVDGALLAAVGPAALLGAPYRWNGLADLGLLAGLAAVAAALLPSPRTCLAAIRRAVPRLFPYASVGVNAGIFLLWVFATVAIYQGCLDIFAGAHAGGGGWGVADPGRLQLLIALASILFTLVPVYLAFALGRAIPMGRWSDSADGKDTYGTAVTPPSPALVRAAMRMGPPPAAPTDLRWAVALVTLVTAAFVSIGIQLVEVGTAPIPPGLWLESQAALPVYAVALALGIRAVDGSVRGLETRFWTRVRPRPRGPSAPPGTGFVQ